MTRTRELGLVVRRTKAAAEPDDEARHRAIHASRYLRRRRTNDGAGELLYRSTLDEVADIFAIVQGWADQRFRLRAEGRHEPGEAYLADGLLDAVRASRVTAGADGGGTTGAATTGAATTGAATTGAATTGAATTGAATTDAATTDAATTDAEVGGARAARTKGPVTSVGDDQERTDDDRTDEQDAPTDLFADEAAPPAPVASPPPTPPAECGLGKVGQRPVRPPRPVKVIVRIDLDALLRGWPIDGEVCEIAGLAPSRSRRSGR